MPIDVVDVVWNDFMNRFMKGEIIYVTEQEERYILMTADNHFIVRAVYPKGNYVDNIRFVDMYLSNGNIVWTTTFEEEIVEEYIEEEIEDDISELESPDSEGQFE